MVGWLDGWLDGYLDGWVLRPRPRLPRVARGAALKMRNPIFYAKVIIFEGFEPRDHQIRNPREKSV